MTTNTPDFLTYRDVEEAIWRVVEDDFFSGHFLQTLGSGGYTHRQIRYFAVQYSFYSRHFPRVLSAAITAMPPLDNWWVPLADNLWDEAGRGVPGKSHARLYRTFLTSVDPALHFTPDGFPAGETADDCIMEAIDTFISYFQKASPLQAMAAVGLGSELFAGAVMGQIGESLRHPLYNQQQDLNLLFWDIHADEHEPRHYQLCKDILETFALADELTQMYQAGRYIAKSEARMYEKLHAKMQSL